MKASQGLLATACLATSLLAADAGATQVRITITNNAPTGGTYLTPVWVGFHDGSFDSFSAGATASAGIEAVAEVGQTGMLSGEFAGNGVDGTVGSAPIAPGQSVSSVFNLATDGSNNYLSFASMILPSSDFFIGNDDPLAHAIGAVLDGSQAGTSFTIGRVYDAGTEQNDFLFSAGNGLFAAIGLPASDAANGNDQSLPIALASGADFASFLNVGGADVSGLDFDNFASLASIQVSAVPVPAALPLFLTALGGLGAMRRRGR